MDNPHPTSRTDRTESPALIEGNVRLPWLVERLVRRLGAIRHGSLQIRMADGAEKHIRGSQAGPEATLTLRRPMRALLRLATRGEIGFSEGYLAGDWDTPDLKSLLEWAIVNESTIARVAHRPAWQRAFDRVRHVLRRNSIRGSRANIRFHYDLGNDFYRLWLDPTMTYSSALFTRGDEALASAQEAKYARLLDSLDAAPGARILEIGCGWGGFAEFAARRGFHVTGITLSQEQYDYASNRIAEAGLEAFARFELRDYRHIDERYDHIVSIEMFEAVGEAWWPTYFQQVEACLKPGGRAALQVITIEESAFEHYRRSADFIQLYIFPGGMLPPASKLLSLGNDAGLKTIAQDFYAEDYARTLHFWFEEVRRAAQTLESLGYDARFQRMWQFYLLYCEVGFRAGRIDLTHTIFEKPAAGRVSR